MFNEINLKRHMMHYQTCHDYHHDIVHRMLQTLLDKSFQWISTLDSYNSRTILLFSPAIRGAIDCIVIPKYRSEVLQHSCRKVSPQERNKVSHFRSVELKMA